MLQDVVIFLVLQPDLRRHAVEALRAVLRAGQRHISDSARDAAVAVFKRVDGDEPEMREAGFQDRIDRVLAFEPLQEACISLLRRFAFGASKCTFSFPTGRRRPASVQRFRRAKRRP